MTAPELAAFDMAELRKLCDVGDDVQHHLVGYVIDSCSGWASPQARNEVQVLRNRYHERGSALATARDAFPTIDAEMTRLRERVAELERKDDAHRNLIARLVQEAQGWAMEARGHKSTVHDAYQAVTEGTGEPGNWHGAKPIVEALRSLRAQLSRLRAEASADKAKGGVLAPFDPDNYGPPNADGWMRSKDGSHSRRLNTAAAACVPGPVFVAQTGEASALKPDQVSVRVRPNTPATPTPTGARVAGEDGAWIKRLADGLESMNRLAPMDARRLREIAERAALATAPDPAASRREALLQLYRLYENHTDKGAASSSAEELMRRTHMAAAIKEAIEAIRSLAGEPTP